MRWAALKKEKRPGEDVAAGRRWVAAYVPFVHWAEGIHAAAGAKKGGSDHAAHMGAEKHAERDEGAAPAKPHAH